MTAPIAPPVVWAQRKDKIFLTFQVENVINPKIKIEANEIKFDSEAADKKHYNLIIPLYNEINAEKSTQSIKVRQVELVLKKKDDDITFWPQLTKEKGKYHWLKVDFNKWVDEDEDLDDDLLGGGDLDETDMLSQFSSQFGGLGDGDDSENLEPDSDDEETDNNRTIEEKPNDDVGKPDVKVTTE